MKCIFTGKDADSAEHVIPLWLQGRFNLSEQTLRIPNGTTLKYKHHRVPADIEANNRFGVIENHISRGSFDPAEVYLWALKIHIGCVYRDASLLFDVKDPSSPFILDVSNFAHDVWLFQQIFQNWSNGGTTYPSPFGSVFICLDSLKSYAPVRLHSLQYDRGRGHRHWREIYIGIPMGRMRCNAYQHPRPVGPMACPAREGAGTLQMGSKRTATWRTTFGRVNMPYWFYRHQRSLSIIKTPSQIVRVPPVWRPEGEPMEEAEYRYVCRNFGLDLVQYNGEVNNVYRPLQDFIHA